MACDDAGDEEEKLPWYRVTASVQASSAEEAEAIVARSLPPKREGSLAHSHVNTVEEIRWYTATVTFPPPHQAWCTAVLGDSPEEVRSTLERDFEPEQIGEIKPLIPPDEDVLEARNTPRYVKPDPPPLYDQVFEDGVKALNLDGSDPADAGIQLGARVLVADADTERHDPLTTMLIDEPKSEA